MVISFKSLLTYKQLPLSLSTWMYKGFNIGNCTEFINEILVELKLLKDIKSLDFHASMIKSYQLINKIKSNLTENPNPKFEEILNNLKFDSFLINNIFQEYFKLNNNNTEHDANVLLI